MSQTLKLLTVSDLHADKRLVEQLAKAVKQQKPDILAVVGDFLDATPFDESKFAIDDLARAFSKLPVGEILFVRGNHEDSALWTFQREYEETGKAFHLLDHSAIAIGPLVIVGFPCLMGSFDGITDPICSQPHKWIPPILVRYANATRTLWLMHEPPIGTELSRREGVLSGNFEWTEAVERFRPWIVVFGHDHDTPRRKKLWNQTLENGTVCVNVGQDSRLHYCILEMTFPADTPSLPKRVKIRAYPYGQSLQLPRRQ